MSVHRRLVLAGAVLLAVFAVLFASGAATATETASACDRIGASAPVAPAPEAADPHCLRSCVIHCQALPPVGTDPLIPSRPRETRYGLINDAPLTSRTDAEDPPPRL